ncbi:MAG TPA: tetratricopeptide repeat protein, partial [Anaerolineales bacterium]
DLEAALQAYQKTVELAPNDPAYYRLLAGFSARYEYQVGAVGLSAARRAVLLDPANPDSLDSMGQVLFLLGDLTSAERFFLRALDADPNHAPAHLHLGLAYMLQGERDRAYQEWKLVTSLASGTPAAEQAERLVRNYFP